MIQAVVTTAQVEDIYGSMVQLDALFFPLV